MLEILVIVLVIWFVLPVIAAAWLKGTEILEEREKKLVQSCRDRENGK